MVVSEKAKNAMLARNYHMMVRLGAKKHIRSVNTEHRAHMVHSVHIIHT